MKKCVFILLLCTYNIAFAQQNEYIYECKTSQERIYMSYKISTFTWLYESKTSQKTPLLFRYDKMNPNSDGDTIFVYFEKNPTYDFAFRQIRRNKADMFPQKLIRINPDKSQSVFELAIDTQDLIDYTGTATVIISDLSVRNEPNIKSSIVTTLQEGENVEVLAKTVQKSTISIRNKPSIAPWYKIVTSKGQKGWVFGGGISQSRALPPEFEDLYHTIELLYDGYDIYLENGQKIKLTNDLADDKLSYWYSFNFFVKNYYVFNYQTDSNRGLEEKILVNKYTGKITKIKTYQNGLYFSDDASYLLNAYSEKDNVFQIWKLNQKDIALFYETTISDVEGYNFQFESFKWIDNQSIEIKYLLYDKNQKEIKMTQTYRLGEKLKLKNK
jgi:hypothetical protein